MDPFSISTPLDEIELNHLAENIGPYDWRKLGLYLGIPEARLSNWEHQYAMNTEQATTQMLFTWHNNQIPQLEREHLIEALEKCRLRNLGDKIRHGHFRGSMPKGMRQIPPESFDNCQQAPQVQTASVLNRTAGKPGQPGVPGAPPVATRHEITEILLRDLSQQLGNEWRMVGTYLGFQNAEIQILQEQYTSVKECIFQMLLQWRNVNGMAATKDKLKRALNKSERSDLEEVVDNPEDF